MTIKFITKGNKEILQIYVRLKEGHSKIDATSKIGLSVQSKHFHKGEIKYPNTRVIDAEQKKEKAKVVKQLANLEKQLNDIRATLMHALNTRKDYEVINSKWIKGILNPQSNNKTVIPDRLYEYFNFYFKSKDLNTSTIKKIKTVQSRLKRYEQDYNTTVYVQEVNKAFAQLFQQWHDEQNYHHNTKLLSLKIILTVCNHAHNESDLPVHPQLQSITKNKKFKKTENIYLDFKELQKIENTTYSDKKYDITRDWLLISCNTAQRVSDFMRFNVNDIVKIEGDSYLNIAQKKTDKPILVYLNDSVLSILEKYNGQFPPLFSKTSKESNENYYNRYVKVVCRLAGIKNKITKELYNPDTDRHEKKTAPKHKFVSSHIGRRSYATNYYGLINTALLIGATGHSTEEQFLRYVNRPPQQNAKDLARAMKALKANDEVTMIVHKNA